MHNGCDPIRISASCLPKAYGFKATRTFASEIIAMTKRFYLFALTGFCMFAASLGICTGLILNAFNVDASNLPVAQFIVAIS